MRDQDARHRQVNTPMSSHDFANNKLELFSNQGENPLKDLDGKSMNEIDPIDLI